MHIWFIGQLWPHCFKKFLIFLTINVTQPLKEKHTEDIILKVTRINATSEDIRRLPEVGLEVLES